MKKVILSYLFFMTLCINSAEQSLTVISKQISSVKNLSDTDLEKLWKKLQTLTATSTDAEFRKKSQILVNRMIQEKRGRILNNKEAQDAISKVLLEVLLAVSFQGTALMLSGESAEYSIYASVTHQLASSMGSYLTKNMGPVANTTASTGLQMFTDWVLKLPSPGQGLATLDPISIIPLGISGTKMILNQLNYTEKTIAAFNQVQQTVGTFFQSLTIK